MEQGLPSLPNGWHKKQLGDVVKLSQGTQVPVGDQYLEQEDGLIRFLRISDFVRSDEPPRYILNPGSQYLVEADDICMIRYGDAGRAVTGLAGALANNLFKISPIESLLKRFLFLQLCSPRCVDYLRAANNSSTMPAISFKAVNAMEVSVAPLDEQKRIVEKLDVLLTRIDTAIEHLQESVTLADALYASTINEQMMQAIELAGLSTVEKHIEQIQTGTTPPTKQPEFYENGDINWFAPSDFGDHDILFDSNKKLSQKAFDAGKARKFDAGTIMLVAIGATIGKIGYLEQDASSNQQITGMKFNSDIIPRYAYYWFRFIKPEILTNASTATLPIINQKGIKALSFCAPNRQLQETICKKIDEVSSFRNTVKAELNEKVELMRSLKASILDSAFKGEL